MISVDKGLRIFRNMLLARRFEEAMIKLWETVDVEGYRHVYIGQEAIGAVVMDALGNGDLLTTTHRNHGHIIMRGADPKRAFAEILGRVDGFNQGRGGSAGMTDRNSGFLSTTGIVGGGVGTSMGAGLALKIKNKRDISVAFFGDGGLEEGIAFESMNFAALYDLPVLFICENNSVGVVTGRAQNEWSSSSISAETLGDIPRSLKIATKVVDGADVEAIDDVLTPLVDNLRKGIAPAFVEMRTHRWPGSRLIDPQLVTGITDLNSIWDKNANKTDHADWVNKYDPIILLGRKLMADNNLSQEQLITLDLDVIEELEKAKNAALESPFPSSISGLTGTFA